MKFGFVGTAFLPRMFEDRFGDEGRKAPVACRILGRIREVREVSC